MGFTGGTLQWSRLRLLILCLLVFTASVSHAKIRYILDVDGTLVNDHGPNSGWKTYWVLKRVDHYHTSLQLSAARNQEWPAQLEISFAEYQRLLPSLAKGERLLGDMREVTLDDDPVYPRRLKKIIPGLYRVSDDLSYVNFRANPGGKSHLLRDYLDAKKRQKISGARWRGGAFALLQAAMSDENELDSLVLSTARYQPDEDFDAWLKALKRDGYLAHVESRTTGKRPRYHFLSSPESILFGRGLVEKKGKVVHDEAVQLLNGPFTPHDELVTDEYEAKAGTKRKFHTMVIAEDDAVIVDAISRKLELLSSDLHFSQQIKFVLFNVGDPQEVADARWPWRWTVFDRGFGRSALPEEVALWAKQRSVKKCSALIAGKFDEVD